EHVRREGRPMEATGCPGRAELEGFVVGSLSAPVFARVADHVARCPDCEGALEELDSLDDPLLSRLRRSALADDPAVEPVPQELIAAVRAALTGSVRASPSAGEGRRLGRFELLEPLGAGSFGYVFRARDTGLGRVVAIKIPRAGNLADTEDVTR